VVHVFASIALRFRVEVEALNMVEALGAYTRHRTASVLKRVKRGNAVAYKLVVAPAVSGQSIANGYQRALVELAVREGLPVCDQCRRYESIGGFIKHATEGKADHDSLIQNCVVEDLTGFLVPEAGVRRTSPVMFSYLVPDTESAKAVLESQFHVRYNFETMEHNPFNIESGTAVYMLTVNIDVDRIGRRSDGKAVPDRDRRVELAFKALAALIEGLGFGAKKARYLPVVEVLGGVGAVSDPIPFVVSPPRVYPDGDNYISKTVSRASKYVEALKEVNERLLVAYMDCENLGVSIPSGTDVEVVRASTVVELLETLLGAVKRFQGTSR
jgi:CRISPR-associated protein Csa2